MVKDDNYYLTKTVEEIDTIISYSKGYSLIDLVNNPAVLDGIVFRMIQMSEQIDRVSEEFKLIHNEIKWINIKGFRNRLVHDYGGVDLQFVYNAISKDIIDLKEKLLKVIQ